ncbi:MAG: protein kinase [Myxococcales bacterium]
MQHAAGALIDGRYRVEGRLGAGGMGVVYAVGDEGTGQRVALKQLSSGAGREAQELFEQEYRVLAGLRHARIVRAYDFGVDRGAPYYTMTLLSGGDLSAAPPMPWRQVCATLRDVASVLGVLHARRMVHRDISPRNLWRTLDGRIQLLDFGAMADFGVQSTRIGTAPFMPPEAVKSEALDGRSDLYALGALGYWLLTTTHAYRARRMDELPGLWLRPPASPSDLVSMIEGADRSIPKELDDLLLAMLALDADARPANTTEVIDRLNYLADLVPEAEAEVLHGYLESKAFVGRRRELSVLDRQFRRAAQAGPTASLVSGPAGSGRSRLLEEAAMAARVEGAATVAVGRTAGQEPYAGATALGLELLRAMPRQAREAAAPIMTVLSSVSGQLGQALQGGAIATAPAGPYDRGEKQAALQSWIASLSRQRTLVILVDDVDFLDEESQALFVALTTLEAGHRLALVVSSCADSVLAARSPVHHLQSASRTLPLAPLSPEETFELLRSTFNDVPYLERLAAQLHGASHGNPRHCLMLADQLVHLKVIVYADGAFQLPREFPEIALPEGIHDSILGTIDRLSTSARQLARLLSVPDHGTLTLAMIMAASGRDVGQANASLEELIRRRVLHGSVAGYGFVHAASREKLCGELSDLERKRVHQAIAQHLEAQAGVSALGKLRAGVHWLHAGDLTRAEPLIFEAGLAHTQGIHGEELRVAAPMFAECDRLFRALGRDDHALYLPLGALALASYFADQRYSQEYGARAIAVLSDGIGLTLAGRLERWLGARLALIVSLVVAGLRLRRRDYAPDLKRLIYVMVAAATAMAGHAGVCVDPEAVRRHTAGLRKLGTLRSADVARLLAEFNEAIALNAEGKSHAAQTLLSKVIADLETPDALPTMAADARRNFLAGALGIHAAHDLGLISDRCLFTADKMEKYGGVHAVWASQVRAIYYDSIGQADRAAHFRREVELGIIRLGSAWQVDTWRAPVQVLSFPEDPSAFRRMAEEMERLSGTAPSYEAYARWNRAAYLVLRGRYEDALALYRGEQEPRNIVASIQACGWFAAAMNGVGAHERAQASCVAALARIEPEDRHRPAHSIRLEVELAVAEAGLGQHERAHERVDALFARHVPHTGPVVRGYLHSGRARVFLLAGDVAGYEQAVAAAALAYAPLNVPFLHERIAVMRRIVSERSEGVPPHEVSLHDSHLLTRVQLRLASVSTADDRARHDAALLAMLEVAGTEIGFIVRTTGECVAPRGVTLTPEVVCWAEAHLAGSFRDEATEVQETTVPSESARQADTLTCAGVAYRTHILQTRVGELLGALVLGSVAVVPAPLPRKILAMLAEYLVPERRSGAV